MERTWDAVLGPINSMVARQYPDLAIALEPPSLAMDSPVVIFRMTDTSSEPVLEGRFSVAWPSADYRQTASDKDWSLTTRQIAFNATLKARAIARERGL